MSGFSLCIASLSVGLRSELESRSASGLRLLERGPLALRDRRHMLWVEVDLPRQHRLQNAGVLVGQRHQSFQPPDSVSQLQ